MQYILTFLEGVISFISPCMLPMIPVYLTYFGGKNNEKKKAIPGAVSFVIGFSLVFCILGVLAGTVGGFLNRHQMIVNIISGAFVIFFGLSYLEIIPLKFLKGINKKHDADSVLSAFIFGMIFSVNLTPCVGAFLGSALMMAASVGEKFQGLMLLFVYSMGLGIPFIISAVLIDKLKGAFSFIKKHYKIINTVCGIFLIIIGFIMMFGLFNKYLSLL